MGKRILTPEQLDIAADDFNLALSKVGAGTNFHNHMKTATEDDKRLVRGVMNGVTSEKETGCVYDSRNGVSATYVKPKSDEADIDRVVEQHSLKELHERGLLHMSLKEYREAFGLSEKEADQYRSSESQGPRLTVTLHYPLLRGIKTYLRREVDEFFEMLRTR